MNTVELTTAFNTLSKRLDQIQRLIRGAASTVQVNEMTLLLEKEVIDLKVEVTTLKNRVSVLETTVNALV